jgi:hypothetical protein
VNKHCESWLIETVFCCGEEQFVRLALSRRGHRLRARLALSRRGHRLRGHRLRASRAVAR